MGGNESSGVLSDGEEKILFICKEISEICTSGIDTRKLIEGREAERIKELLRERDKIITEEIEGRKMPNNLFRILVL